MKLFGFERLREQLIEFIDGDWGWMAEEAKGDSQIERLLFFALFIRCKFANPETPELFCSTDDAMTSRLMESPPHQSDPRNMMIVQPQAIIGARRVDFLIYVLDWRDEDNQVWRALIIECDGHDFHERTKVQASRDKSKDRQATIDGIETFRFTGSEIWKDPWGCAEQISQWAARWRF